MSGSMGGSWRRDCYGSRTWQLSGNRGPCARRLLRLVTSPAPYPTNLLSGSRRNYIGQAKYAARLAERALAELGLEHLTVEPALVFWGPGAPAIEGGSVTTRARS